MNKTLKNRPIMIASIYVRTILIWLVKKHGVEIALLNADLTLRTQFYAATLYLFINLHRYHNNLGVAVSMGLTGDVGVLQQQQHQEMRVVCTELKEPSTAEVSHIVTHFTMGWWVVFFLDRHHTWGLPCSMHLLSLPVKHLWPDTSCSYSNAMVSRSKQIMV